MGSGFIQSVVIVVILCVIIEVRGVNLNIRTTKNTRVKISIVPCIRSPLKWSSRTSIALPMTLSIISLRSAL